MLLLMLIGVGSAGQPQRAYAAISFALNNDGALTFSVVNSAVIGITEITSADGTVE